MPIPLSPASRETFLPTAGEADLVIFCVGQDLRRVAAFRSWAIHRGISVHPLVGCYRGMMERSFAVAARHFSAVSAWTRAEESVLLLGPVRSDGARPARLDYADGRTEDLGAFIACSRDTAIGSPSWTYDPITQTHFICTDCVNGNPSGGHIATADAGV